MYYVEHTISSETEQHLQFKMEYLRFLPHGNPLPGYEDKVSRWLPLSAIEPGKMVAMLRIHESLEDRFEGLYHLES